MMPVVGIICDVQRIDGHPAHTVGNEYVSAVRDGAGALPLLIPAADAMDVSAILDAVDGLLFTGAISNVDPAHYGGAVPRPGTLGDAARDALALPLLRAAVAKGMPVLCICRGFQELNVAFGGTLYPHVHEIPGRLDHRENAAADLDTQYAPAHAVTFTAGGVLARLAGASGAQVNSLHHQGIDRLAPGLVVEAVAPDGQIEAVTIADARGFVLGVQWHPEWRWADDSLSVAIFRAFGAAIRA